MKLSQVHGGNIMWDKEKIQTLLDSNPKAVVKGLLTIYNLQTEFEKDCLATVADNGVGFSAFDAQFLTEMAQRVQKGYTLSLKQFAVTKNKVKRYWRQLANIANAKAPKVIEPTIEKAGYIDLDNLSSSRLSHIEMDLTPDDTW